MRKTLVLLIMLTLLSVGTIGYAAAHLLPLGDQVLVREITAYGDSSTAEGLTVHFLADVDGVLNWNTAVQLGTEPAAETDYTFTLPPVEVDHRMEKANRISMEPTVWGVAEFNEYDAKSGEKYPDAYSELAEGLKPGETASRIIFVKDVLDYYSLNCELHIPGQELTFYDIPPAEEKDTLHRQMAQLFFQEFRFPVHEYLQARLELTYTEYGYYNYSFEGLSDYSGFYLDVVETVTDSGIWFTFNTTAEGYNNLDVSHLPNGYGLWYIPVSDNQIQPELDMIYPINPKARILDLATSSGGDKILLSTMEDGHVQVTVLNAATAEVLQQIPLLEIPAQNAGWCFYEEDGCIVIALIDTVSREKNLILLAEDAGGQFQVLWNLELTDDDSPVVYFHHEADSSYRNSYDYWPVMAWNGEKLAFAMTDYRLCTFQVAVYDNTGLVYHGKYNTSLNLYPCDPAAYDPLTLTWNGE